MTIRVTTERLYLREHTINDAPSLLDLNSDPEVTRYTGDGPLKDLEEAKRILNDIILPQYPNRMGRWAVHLKADDTFIGWCGLKYIAELDEIDLGYRYFKKYWGQGYATEAAKATMDYGINVLQLERIVGRAAVDNHNSIRVLQKAGMQFTGSGIEHGDAIVKYHWTRTAG